MQVATPLRIALFVAAASGMPADLCAQEYCVACTQPTAVYRCSIVDPRRTEGQPFATFCTSTLAKEGKHASCAIRGGTVFDCDGPVKRVALPPPPNPGTGVSGNQPDGGGAQIAAPPKPPPATVERLAREAAKSSGQEMEKAGKSAGKVWTCITSLFTSC